MIFANNPRRRRSLGSDSEGAYEPSDLPPDLQRQLREMQSAKDNIVLGGINFGDIVEYTDVDMLTNGSATSERGLAEELKLLADVDTSQEHNITVDGPKLRNVVNALTALAKDKKERVSAAVALEFQTAIDYWNKVTAFTVLSMFKSAQENAASGLKVYVRARQMENEASSAATSSGPLPTGTTPTTQSSTAASITTSATAWSVSEIRLIQQALKDKSYYTKAVDGVMGGGTTSALNMVFQGDSWKGMSVMEVLKFIAGAPKMKSSTDQAKKPSASKTPAKTPAPAPSGSSKLPLVLGGLLAAGIVGGIAYAASRNQS